MMKLGDKVLVLATVEDISPSDYDDGQEIGEMVRLSFDKGDIWIDGGFRIHSKDCVPSKHQKMKRGNLMSKYQRSDMKIEAHVPIELTRKEIKTVTFKIMEGAVPQIKINEVDFPVVSCSYQYATSADESEGSNNFLATVLNSRNEQITLTVDNLTGKTTFQ